jgi:hypothetical protein
VVSLSSNLDSLFWLRFQHQMMFRPEQCHPTDAGIKSVWATMATSSSSIADYLAKNPSEKPAEGPIRVCVGGGAGFIGSHIAKNLMEQVSDNEVS